MNEMLKEFLDSKKAEEAKKYEDKKKQTLLDMNFYEKVYSPDGNYSEEYCYSDWNDGDSKYFKKVPIEITDEEYQELKKYTAEEEKVSSSNAVATALTIIAWFVFIGGFIAGIMLGQAAGEIEYIYGDAESQFSFSTALVYWGISLVSGTMFLGFAEIIKLLDAIRKK